MRLKQFKTLTPDQHTAVQSIFFASSDRQDFDSEVERQAFYNRWMGVYLLDSQTTDWILALDGDEVQGYLVGCSDSQSKVEAIGKNLPSYFVFKDLFKEFPAHLHMNMSATCRGLGVGGRLLECYKSLLDNNEIRGVHIVTAPAQRNVSFYKRQGFTHEVQRNFQNYPLLFLGCRLSDKKK